MRTHVSVRLRLAVLLEITCLPEDIGDAEDAEQLLSSRPVPGGFGAGDDGAVSLRPNVASALHQNPIAITDRQALHTHCRGMSSISG